MTALQRYLSSHLAARLLHNWTLPHACFDGNIPLPGLGGLPQAPLPALPKWKAQARRVGAVGAASPSPVPGKPGVRLPPGGSMGAARPGHCPLGRILGTSSHPPAALQREREGML